MDKHMDIVDKGVKQCTICLQTKPDFKGTKCSACIKKVQRSRLVLSADPPNPPEKVLDITGGVDISEEDGTFSAKEDILITNGASALTYVEFHPATMLVVDTNLPFSHQQKAALALDPRAVHNTRRGKDEWVIPGVCRHGECKNPNCQFL